MRVPVNVQLLSPTRATVVLDHAGVVDCAAGPFEFAERYPSSPRARLRIHNHPSKTSPWSIRRVVRVEYDTGEVESWRVRRRVVDHAGDASVELVPLWMDLSERVLMVDLEDAGITTPRLALLDRLPADAIGVAFDPVNGAPSIGTEPMFLVGEIDPQIVDKRVDVLLTGASPLQVVEAVCSQLQCLWRARLIRSGLDASGEMYEVDLYLPAPEVAVASVGNVPAVANALRLLITDDASELFTVSVPLSAGGEDSQQTTADAYWTTDPGVPVPPFGWSVRLMIPQELRGSGSGDSVPYAGALNGYWIRSLDEPVPGFENRFEIIQSYPPDELIVPGFAWFQRYRLEQANGLPVTRLVDKPGVAQHGVVERSIVYEDVAPLPNLFQYPAMTTETEVSGVTTLDGVIPLGASTLTYVWSTADVDVTVGERSPIVTLDGEAALSVPFTGYRVVGVPPARSLWISLRVLTGQLRINSYRLDGDGVPYVHISAAASPSEFLTEFSIELGGENDPDDYVFGLVSVGGPCEVAINAITIVPSTTHQPYQPLMGPNALWGRAWDDLLLSRRNVTTAESEFIDLALLGLSTAPISAGDWVQIHPDGRSSFPVQVLETRWMEGLHGQAADPQRQARFGPPPPEIGSLIRQPRHQLGEVEGSRRAPDLARLIDLGPVMFGRAVETSDGSTITVGSASRTFMGETYAMDTLALPAGIAALAVRRLPPVDGVPVEDAALLRLHPS